MKNKASLPNHQRRFPPSPFSSRAILSIAKPATQMPSTQASRSNQPISFETISLSMYGSREAARCESAAMLSESDRTGEGAGVGPGDCAWTNTGSHSTPITITVKIMDLYLIAVSLDLYIEVPYCRGEGVGTPPL